MLPEVVRARDLILAQDVETRCQIAAGLLRSLGVDPEGVVYHPERSPNAPRRVDWSIVTGPKDPLIDLSAAREHAQETHTRTLIVGNKCRPGRASDERPFASGLMVFKPRETLRFEIKTSRPCEGDECRAVGHVERSPGGTLARDMLLAFLTGGVESRESNRAFLECVHFDVLGAQCQWGDISHWRSRTDEWLSYARASARTLLAEARRIEDYGLSQRAASTKGGAANRTTAGAVARALAEIIVAGDQELLSGKRLGVALYLGERLPAFLERGSFDLEGIGRVVSCESSIGADLNSNWRQGSLRLVLEGRKKAIVISGRLLEEAGRKVFQAHRARL